MIPSSHHGRWTGLNRLWLEHPSTAKESATTLAVTAENIVLTWSFKDTSKLSTFKFAGPTASARVAWTDTFHAEDGMVLHGPFQDGLLTAYGTYPDGEGGFWGWTIELDFRDPAAIELRMFNIPPGQAPEIAVAVHAVRAESA